MWSTKKRRYICDDILATVNTYATAALASVEIRLYYVLFSSFRKIFRTESKDVDRCMLLLFECSSVLTVVSKRKAKIFLGD